MKEKLKCKREAARNLRYLLNGVLQKLMASFMIMCSFQLCGVAMKGLNS